MSVKDIILGKEGVEKAFKTHLRKPLFICVSTPPKWKVPRRTPPLCGAWYIRNLKYWLDE